MIIMRELDPDLCDGCGLCVIACHGGGVALGEGRVSLVETDVCDFCCVCEAVCPYNAIKCFYIVVPAED